MASLRASRTLWSPVRRRCTQQVALGEHSYRAFSSTRVTASQESDAKNTLPPLATNPVGSSNPRSSPNFLRERRPNPGRASSSNPPSISKILDGTSDSSFLTPQWANSLQAADEIRPYRLYVYAHKHNTHITLAQPSQSASETISSSINSTTSTATEQKKMVNTLISLSTGNLGFKKAQRSSYDAAYQLAGFVFRQIQEKGILRNMNKLEVSLRGFGAGREAVTKAILGSEGRNIRDKIVAVMDATRLKVGGGARAPRPRRL